MRTLRSLTLPGLVLLSGIGPASFSGNGPSSSEDEPVAYRFRERPIDGGGIASMAELRGKPTLIDFWGTR